MNKNYGKELILDLHECNPDLFNRRDLRRFFKQLCEQIDMERCKLTFWDYRWSRKPKDIEAHLEGTTAVQFISTSNVTIHTLTQLKAVYLNIFSCKDFNTEKAAYVCRALFEGKVVTQRTVIRK